MRFLDDGPDIPDDLLDARDQGEVVFICGAGVSKRHGLPLFKELVDQIYEHLNAEYGENPAEEIAYDTEEYDRVLKLLSDRMVDGKFDEALIDCLSPPDGPFTVHKNLLDLSIDKDGRPCLITTNFDTLFERSHPDLPSYASAALPAPNSERFYGIMHLHGRLADKARKIDRTDLVLTSAQFGDAYLRSGWATRFIYDLIRCRTIVLVGYQASDPPMRYLLEVIDADSKRFKDLKTVYSFVQFDPEKDHDEARVRAISDGKGTTAIPYASVDEDDHNHLYDTISAWADYARDSQKWRGTLFERAAKSDPADLPKLVRHQVISLVRRADGAYDFANRGLSGKWFKVFGEANLLSQDKPIIQAARTWIRKTLADQDIIQWCATSPLVGKDLLDFVRWALSQETPQLDAIHKACWQAIFWSRENWPEAHRHEWYRSLEKLKNGGTSLDLEEIIVSLLAPRIAVSKPMPWPGNTAGTNRPKRPGDILHIEFKAADYPTPTEVFDVVSKDPKFVAKICRRLTSALAKAYERADHLGGLLLYSAFNFNVPSVAKHEQNEHHHGVYPTVRLIIDLWEELVSLDFNASKEILQDWHRNRNFPLFQRMVLHAATFGEVMNGEEAAASLIALNDKEFYYWARRESMRLMAKRWQNFPPEEREKLLGRILEGPPKTLYKEDLEEEKFAGNCDREIYEKLHRIKNAGNELESKALDILANIQKRYPEWKPGEGDRDDFSSYSWSTPAALLQGDTSKLDRVPTEDLLAKAQELMQEYEQHDIWRLYVNEASARCFEALELDSKKGNWPKDLWYSFFLGAFSIEENKPLDQDLFEQLFKLFQVAPNEVLKSLRSNLIYIFSQHYKRWTDASIAEKLKIWDWLWELTVQRDDKEEADSKQDDLVSRAFNEPGGELARTLLQFLKDKKPQNRSKIPNNLLRRFNRIIGAVGCQARMARIMLSFDCSFLYLVDPEWVVDKLVPYFSWENPEALAIHQAYHFPGRFGPADLFLNLKPYFLEAFERQDWPGESQDNLSSHLVLAVMNSFRDDEPWDISTSEARKALRVSEARVRHTAAWFLWNQFGGLSREKGEEVWTNTVKPTFKALWPPDRNCQDGGSSYRLAEMALSTGNAFPDAFKTIKPYLVKTKEDDVCTILSQLKGRNREQLEKFPAVSLEMVDKITGEDSLFYPDMLREFLNEIFNADKELGSRPSFRRLDALATNARHR